MRCDSEPPRMFDIDSEEMAEHIRDHILARKNTLPLDELNKRLQEIGGCSNHGCEVVQPIGQGTNGPCHCLKTAI